MLKYLVNPPLAIPYPAVVKWVQYIAFKYGSAQKSAKSQLKSGEVTLVNCNWEKQAINSFWHDITTTIAVYKQFNEVLDANWREIS